MIIVTNAKWPLKIIQLFAVISHSRSGGGGGGNNDGIRQQLIV